MQYLGPWLICVENFSIVDEHNSYELEPLLFNLLRYFLEHSQRIISRQELAEQVWRQGYVDDNAINRAISDLRKALQHPLLTTSPLKTHHRKGYSLLWSEQQQQHFEQSLDSAVSESAQITASCSVPPIASTVAYSLNTQQSLIKVSTQSSERVTENRSKNKPTATSSNGRYWSLLFALPILVVSWWLAKQYIATSTSETLETVTPKTHSKTAVNIEQKLTWQKGIEYNLALSDDRQLLAYNHTFNTKLATINVRPNPTLSEASQTEVRVAEKGHSLYLLGWQPEQLQLLVRLSKDDMSYCIYQIYDFSAFPAYQKRNLDHSCDPTSRNVATLDAAGNKFYHLVKTATGNRNGATAESLVVEHLDTGQIEMIAQPRSSAAGAGIVDIALSPDGNSLAYLHYTDRVSGSIYLYNLVNSEQQILANLKDTGLLLSINWDSEGNHLYGANGTHLLKINVTDKQLEKIALPAGYALGELVLTGERQGIASDFSMLKVNAPGAWHIQVATQLFDSESSRFNEFSQDTGSIGIVRVNPKDPQQLVYSANKGNGWQLWLRQQTKDTLLTNLPDSKIAINNLDWSADGKQLVLAQHGRIWLYDFAEQQLRTLSTKAEFNFPVFEPAGKSLIVQRQQGNQSHLWRLDIATGQLQQLTLQQAIQPHFDQDILYYTQANVLYQFVDGAKQDKALTEAQPYSLSRVFQGQVYQFNKLTGYFSRYPLAAPSKLERIQHHALIQNGLPMFFTLNPHQPEQMFILSILYPTADLYHIIW